MSKLPVFYINLASRPDRREFMEKQFASLGIDAQRIEAVRLDQVPPEVLAIHTDPGNRWQLTVAENACNTSHHKAWRAILASGAYAGIVMEDDVVLDPAIVHFIDSSLIETLGADLVKLETWGEPVWLGGKRQAVAPGFTANRLLSSHMGAAAYILTRDLAERSLADPRAVEMIVDQYFFGRTSPHLMVTDIQQISPAPGIQLFRREATKQDSLSKSDLASSRSRGRKGPGVREPMSRRLANRVRHQWKKLLAGLRIALWSIRDPRALLRGPRSVPFAGDTSRN